LYFCSLWVSLAHIIRTPQPLGWAKLPKPKWETYERLKPVCFVPWQRVLVSYAEERLRGLEEARGALQAEVQENAGRGEAVLALVRQHCLPLEVERYGLFIGDLERVVSLLLCLSARLARVQNALSTVDQHTDDGEKVGGPRGWEDVQHAGCIQHAGYSQHAGCIQHAGYSQWCSLRDTQDYAVYPLGKAKDFRIPT